ncbi:MAG: hypothetical protein PHS14_12145 [Elusimicrobia bacterium]|nr:hypothetical protein [Elusimicrobiota bacterium]
MTPSPKPNKIPEWTDDIKNTPLAAELRSGEVFSFSQSIFIGSDYGGEHQTARHAVYGFLIADLNKFHDTALLQTQAREIHFGGSPHTVEFKKLAASGRDRALPDWLTAADSLHGYLITLAVDVELLTLFGRPNELASLTKILSDAGLGNWKAHIAEKLLRILHFQSYLCSQFLRPSQKVLWMTDRDAIAANSAKTVALGKIWAQVFELYVPAGAAAHSLGMALPFNVTNPEDRQLNDALSYPDLASGALEEVLAESDSPKDTTGVILRWLAVDSPTLKKRTLRIKPFMHPDGRSGFQMSYLQINLT